MAFKRISLIVLYFNVDIDKLFNGPKKYKININEITI